MIFKGKKIQLKTFDIIVIFIFIFIAISLFFVLFRKQSEINVVIEVNEESLAYQTGGVPNWFAQFLHVGMKEADVFGRPMAEIKGIQTYYSPTEEIKGIQTDSSVDQRSVVHLIVALKTTYSLSNRQYTYKGKNVLIGSTIELSLDNLLVKGLIIDIEGSTKNNSKKLFSQARIINLDPAFPQTEGVSSYVAESIQQGDIMKDSLGHTAIKITKKTVEDAKMTVTTASGDVILQRHPMRKDVFLDLEIWAEKIENRYYLFGDTNFPVLINSKLPFYINNTLVWLTITDINDIQ
jgi:hypothetical protein